MPTKHHSSMHQCGIRANARPHTDTHKHRTRANGTVLNSFGAAFNSRNANINYFIAQAHAIVSLSEFSGDVAKTDFGQRRIIHICIIMHITANHGFGTEVEDADRPRGADGDCVIPSATIWHTQFQRKKRNETFSHNQVTTSAAVYNNHIQ